MHPLQPIALMNWAICPLTENQLMVEGLRSDNTLRQIWRTSLIQDSITDVILCTSSGSLYLLQGDIDSNRSIANGFSSVLVKKFKQGFPADWKLLLKIWQPKIARNNKSEHEHFINEDDDLVPRTRYGRKIIPPRMYRICDSSISRQLQASIISYRSSQRTRKATTDSIAKNGSLTSDDSNDNEDEFFKKPQYKAKRTTTLTNLRNQLPNCSAHIEEEKTIGNNRHNQDDNAKLTSSITVSKELNEFPKNSNIKTKRIIKNTPKRSEKVLLDKCVNGNGERRRWPRDERDSGVLLVKADCELINGFQNSNAVEPVQRSVAVDGCRQHGTSSTGWTLPRVKQCRVVIKKLTESETNRFCTKFSSRKADADLNPSVRCELNVAIAVADKNKTKNVDKTNKIKQKNQKAVPVERCVTEDSPVAEKKSESKTDVPTKSRKRRRIFKKTMADDLFLSTPYQAKRRKLSSGILATFTLAEGDVVPTPATSTVSLPPLAPASSKRTPGMTLASKMLLKVPKKKRVKKNKECKLVVLTPVMVKPKRARRGPTIRKLLEAEEKENGDPGRPKITAGKGTMKRKQQLRELLEYENEGYEADLFNSSSHLMKPGLSSSLLNTPHGSISGDSTAMSTPSHNQISVLEPVSFQQTPKLSEDLFPTFSQVDRKAVDTYLYRRKKGQRSQPQTPPREKNAVKELVPPSQLQSTPKLDKLNSTRFFDLFKKTVPDDSDEEGEKDHYFSELESP